MYVSFDLSLYFLADKVQEFACQKWSGSHIHHTYQSVGEAPHPPTQVLS